VPIVKQLIRDVLPAGTRIEAGEAGLFNEVSWVSALKPSPPGFDALKGCEIVIIGDGVASALGVNLSFLVSRLAEWNVSAVCFQGDATDEARRQAGLKGLPLIRIPSQVNLHTLENNIIRLINDERQDLYQKEREFSQVLTELAVAGYDMNLLLNKLCDLTGRIIGFIDLNYKICFLSNNSLDDAYKVMLLPALHRLRVLAACNTVPVIGINLNLDQSCFLGAVKVGKEIKGYLIMLVPEAEISELDRMAVRTGIMALAIEFSLRQAVEETQDRFEGNIVETIITGDTASPALEVKLKKLEVDLSISYSAMVINLPVTTLESQDVLQQVVLFLPKSLVCIRDENLVILNPVKAENTKTDLRKMGEKLIERLSQSYKNPLTLGIGRTYSGLDGMRRSFLEANQALNMGIKLFGEGSITFFGDLGVHRLLFSQKSSGELKSFYDEYLGKLTEYERQPHGELEKTLKAYLSYHNLAETARAIHVHRNTLIYRLTRIREITGLDLDDGETRLALQLAILAGEIIRMQ